MDNEILVYLGKTYHARMPAEPTNRIMGKTYATAKDGELIEIEYSARGIDARNGCDVTVYWIFYYLKNIAEPESDDDFEYDSKHIDRISYD